MTRPDHHHAVAQCLGDLVVDIADPLEQPAFRFTFLREDHHRVAALGEHALVRGVVGHATVSVMMAVDHRCVREEREEVARREQEAQGILELTCIEDHVGAVAKARQRNQERQRLGRVQPFADETAERSLVHHAIAKR